MLFFSHQEIGNKIQLNIILQTLYKSMQKKRQLERVTQITSLPIQYEKRTCTDIFCAILGVAFSLFLIILAIILFDYNKFVKVNFPSDSNGVLCGIQQPAYPYVYFANPPDLSRRVCVKSCPKPGDLQLNCYPTDDIGCKFQNALGFQLINYESNAEQTRSGFFCFPKDQALKQKTLKNSNLGSRQLLYNSLDTIILSFFVALGFAVLFFLFVQFFPKAMNIAVIILGFLVLLAGAICIFTYHSETNVALKITIGCLLILALVIAGCSIWKSLKSFKVYGIFLEQATKFVRQRPITLVYFPVFFMILLAFVCLIVLEFSAFWMSGNLTFDKNKDLFYGIQGALPIVFSVLLGIQAVWGLSFIKTAFNYCISGQTVNWSYKRQNTQFQPLKSLICRHFGSVVGGSFLVGFFTIFDFLFDFLKPGFNSNPIYCYSKFYNSICGCAIFDLVRPDAMAFINLTGNPFCNSSRYCQYLCNKSNLLNNSQTTGRVYRLFAHILLAGILLLFALYIKGVISFYAIIIILVNTLFVSTLLISFHADAAESIQITLLAEEELNRASRNSESGRNDSLQRTNISHFNMHRQLAQQIRREQERANKNDLQRS